MGTEKPRPGSGRGKRKTAHMGRFLLWSVVGLDSVLSSVWVNDINICAERERPFVPLVRVFIVCFGFSHIKTATRINGIYISVGRFVVAEHIDRKVIKAMNAEQITNNSHFLFLLIEKPRHSAGAVIYFMNVLQSLQTTPSGKYSIKKIIQKITFSPSSR